MLSLIACVSADGGLGKDGALLWRFPEDMQFFKETTLGHTVVMGRRTYESIGRPLPKRRNIVISRTLLTKSEECATIEVYPSCENLDKFLIAHPSDEIFIIGGGALYSAYIGRADRLYLTEVSASKPADTFFPSFNRADFSQKVLKTGRISGGCTPDARAHNGHTPYGHTPDSVAYTISLYERLSR